jgi:hypothetical protein
MMSSQGDWSVRANYWRGDRALGGHLRVSEGVLRFEPHGLERALGGDTPFTTPLSDVVRLARAPRSLRVPRHRLIVTTRTGDEAFFLVPKLDSVIQRLGAAIEASGRAPQVDLDPSSRTQVAEEHPDDSAVMNWVYSGWGHIVALAVWLLFFARVLAGSRNDVALAVLGVLVFFSAWRARAGFRRRARIRDQLTEPRPEHT